MLSRIIKIIDRTAIYIGCTALVILVFAAFLQVIMRYVFSHALPWPEELCRFMFITLAYVGIALTMRNDRHLCVDLLITYSSPALGKFFKIFSMACSAAFTAFLGYLCYEMIWDVKELNYMASSMPIPIYITWFPIPICIWLVSLYSVLNIVNYITGTKNTGVV